MKRVCEIGDWINIPNMRYGQKVGGRVAANFVGGPSGEDLLVLVETFHEESNTCGYHIVSERGISLINDGESAKSQD